MNLSIEDLPLLSLISRDHMRIFHKVKGLSLSELICILAISEWVSRTKRYCRASDLLPLRGTRRYKEQYSTLRSLVIKGHVLVVRPFGISRNNIRNSHAALYELSFEGRELVSQYNESLIGFMKTHKALISLIS